MSDWSSTDDAAAPAASRAVGIVLIVLAATFIGGWTAQVWGALRSERHPAPSHAMLVDANAEFIVRN